MERTVGRMSAGKTPGMRKLSKESGRGTFDGNILFKTNIYAIRRRRKFIWVLKFM